MVLVVVKLIIKSAARIISISDNFAAVHILISLVLISHCPTTIRKLSPVALDRSGLTMSTTNEKIMVIGVMEV